MVRLITSLVKFSLKQIWITIIFATPWIIRFLIYASGVSIRLSIVAVASMFKGVDSVAQAIADDWKHRAVEGGFPYLWELHLLRVFYVLAVCTIFAGWMVLLFTAAFAVIFTMSLIF